MGEPSLLTLADVWRADDDEVRHEGGEAGREAGLRHETELQLVQAHGLVVAPPVPPCSDTRRSDLRFCPRKIDLIMWEDHISEHFC